MEPQLLPLFEISIVREESIHFFGRSTLYLFYIL